MLFLELHVEDEFSVFQICNFIFFNFFSSRTPMYSNDTCCPESQEKQGPLFQDFSLSRSSDPHHFRRGSFAVSAKARADNLGRAQNFIFLFFWDRRPKQANAKKWIKNQSKRAHKRGEAGPLGRETPPQNPLEWWIIFMKYHYIR